MKNAIIEPQQTPQQPMISTDAFLEHWQGHRKLTRKVIEAFPEEHLFNYSVGGMRPFADMAMELIDLAAAGINGVATGEWKTLENMAHHAGNIPGSKAALLGIWDELTAQINELWAQIPATRFGETDTAFQLYEGPVFSLVLYWIDNEIHHRGQAYVYLRSLGIEPPAFWDRY